MIEILALVGLVLGIVAVVRRLRARRGSPVAAPPSAVDRWTEREALALIAARVEVSRASLERAFAGQGEAEVVAEVDARIAGIDVAYERTPGGRGEATVRVEVSFDDGHVARAESRVAWSELPESVREELERTGASHVYRPWLLPWHR